MAAKGKFNIFQKNYQQPDKTIAVSMFSTVTPFDQNTSQRGNTKETVLKRQSFRNQIRRKHKDCVKKNIRQQLIKALNTDHLFNQLENMAANNISRNSIESKNLSNFFQDLKSSVHDLNFCKRLQESKFIKKFLLDLYLSKDEILKTEQKILLIKTLIYLTFYSNRSLQQGQKEKITTEMMSEFQKIKSSDFESIEYFKTLLDLLTNITACQDDDFNYYLVDTEIFCLIAEKITQISNQADKCSRQAPNKDDHQKFVQLLTEIRETFIGSLKNLSFCKSEYFFKFTMNQLVMDRNYIELCPIRVISIINDFFQHQKFRQEFFQNHELIGWFQRYIQQICQKKFNDPQSKRRGKFQDVMMSSNEKQLFYQFISCLMTLVYQEWNGNYDGEIKILIENNLNPYCLSEFLIQSAGFEDQGYKIKRNSSHATKAIEIYEYLASNPDISVQALLTVTSERSFEDIIKVFLDKTFFTSCRISDITLSFLNKILSKNNSMLKTFMELRIMDSIDFFLQGNLQIQTQEQIIHFFDLLTLLIISEDQISKNKSQQNEIARLLQINGFIKRIERYQQHNEKQVGDKVQAFLNYFDTTRQGNYREQTVEI